MAVTVLGKTFKNEEERREYFRDELRKKLPELKEMEGFPIGDDEDIIELSDPPYYTACPNPWLNDFINAWEINKNNNSSRNLNFQVKTPFTSSISEGKNNPIYMSHSYHTKVPHPAIMRYILHYTQPGDIVFDGFAGTGMTGVAANLCGSPKKSLKHKIEADSNRNITWGKRKSINTDLSTIASFINKNLCNEFDPNTFTKLSKIINEVDKEWDWMYKTKFKGQEGTILHTIWSQVFYCPECNSEINFWLNAVDDDQRKVKKDFNCPNCGVSVNKRSLDPVYISKYHGPTDEVKKVIKEVPVEIKLKLKGNTFTKSPDQDDLELIEKINSIDYEGVIKNLTIPNGDEISRVLNEGITNVDQLFYKRTYIYLNELIKRIKTQNNSYFNQLFLITSIIQRASKLFRWSKNHAGPLMGTYYLASLKLEVTPKKLLKNKKSIVKNIFKEGIDGGVVNQVSSSTDLSNIKDMSVDYIFVDPPFGANLMYSELNLLYEATLKVQTNNNHEAIESKSQNKSTLIYQNLMLECFKEFYRILKSGKWMTVEFSNTNAAIWNGIQTALQNSGFIIANVSSLDKKQGSFKAVTTATAVKQDLVISCYKPSKDFSSKFDKYSEPQKAVWQFIEEHLNHLPIHLQKENSTTAIIERSPKILYDRLVAFYVQKGHTVPLDASKFQKGLRERFIERDGMFFTNEQVQEYDRKKAEVPNFTQLSILVASEQDGVLWLQNFLKDEPKTYQDIQPEWMQALGGERKGDIIPELKTILEENFLKNNNGEWYVPDPDKEEDLEKLRNRRLLKQFEEYKEQAFKPKGKIKECRVEALRAGFKQSYQDKDFETIVRVGDRIPDNLLMEDEVLLQFYDIAAAKI